jgi:NADH-quinone oxidoreductase subunit A
MYLSLQLTMLAIYSAAALVLVAAMVGLGYVLGPRHLAPATAHPFESGVVTVGDARVRFSAQFYLIAMFFVVFDLESVFIYAWAVAARKVGMPGYIEILTFIGVLLAALIYLWRAGALDWTPARSRARPSGGA